MGSHYKIRAEKTGHYYTHGSITGQTRFVWICLHGYGQLAKYFIQKFEFLDPALHYVVAPEGLNRFYFEGVNERPVASWMTREDRLDEIADYILFLESLRQKTGWDRNPEIKTIYLGFSQGATSLIRWLHDCKPRVNYLLLWAGGLPDDILYKHRRIYFNQMQSFYFLGDKDPYIKIEEWESKRTFIEQTGLQLALQTYEGDHRVEDEVLKRWIEKYLK